VEVEFIDIEVFPYSEYLDYERDFDLDHKVFAISRPKKEKQSTANQNPFVLKASTSIKEEHEDELSKRDLDNLNPDPNS